MGSPVLHRCRVLVTLFCIFGIFLTTYILLPRLVNAEIRRRVRDYVILRPGVTKDTYDRFVSSGGPDTAPYYTKFYFFNITNLDDVRKIGAKPILQELGPYTYRTVEDAYDISFHWNGSLSYKERAMYFREPSMTVGDFDDVVVTLNLALVGVLERVFGQLDNWLLRSGISRLASQISRSGNAVNQGIFMARTVEELLWGYEEPLLGTLARFIDIDKHFRLMQNYTEEDEPPLPSMINTGLNHDSLTGEYEVWEGKTEIDNWNDYSEPVHGSLGTFFHPFLKKNENLSIWVSEMYRSMDIYKVNESDLFGINTYRYRIDPSFWEPDVRYFGQYRGLVNVTSNSAGGSQGPPLYFSPPHFCGADPILMKNVVGLNCDPDRHFFVDIEPYTGLSLKAAIRFMVSTEYSSKFAAIDRHLNQTILPVFWLEEEREATSSQIEPIRTDLYWAVNLRDVLTTVAMALSIVFSVLIALYVAVIMRARMRCQRHTESAQTDQGQNERRIPSFLL